MENLNSFIGKNVMDMDKFLKQSQSRSIKVKHMSDTSDLKPKNFDTWKEFWEDAKKGEMTFPNIEEKCACCNKPTDPKDFVGAHIKDRNGKMYIYPICNSCNSKYGKGKAESPEFSVSKEKCVDFKCSDAVIKKE